MFKHQQPNILRNAMRQLEAAPTSPIRMKDKPVLLEFLRLNPHPALSGRSPADDVSDHVESALTPGGKRKPFGGIL